MPSRLVAVTFEAADPARLARFWADLLGREVVGASVPGDATQVGLRFVPGASGTAGANRLHLHLTSESAEHQRATVETALRLGASHLDVGQRPEEGHVVLADPEGNALCVIEPGNAYLAGCGFLGEVACDGTRDVGLFWSAALGWPLVWDRDGETAIQSPDGGTKLAWSGTAYAGTGRRQRFDVDAAGDLVALGATRRADGTLADPGGMEIGVA